MTNLYQDERLREEILTQLRDWFQADSEESQAEETFYHSLLSRVYESLQATAQPEQALPPLVVYPADDPVLSRAMFVDQDGLNVGLQLLLDLTDSLQLFSVYLLDNYLWQISPVMGDLPPLAELITPQQFPLAALTLHAASLMPDAVTRDGYVKKPGQVILQMMQDAQFTREEAYEKQQAALSYRLIKPAGKDIRMFLNEVSEDPERTVSALVDDQRGPYATALFLQLFLDALYFMLAHETAHYWLGQHTSRPATASQSQAEEAQTDVCALQLLRQVPGFQLRSLLALFGFWHFRETHRSDLHVFDHPFSRSRVMILAASLLREPEGEALRLDVNAGMSMLTTPLEPVGILMTWEDGSEELCPVTIHQYSDMDYNAHLLLYMERKPYQSGLADGGRENVYIMTGVTYEVHLVLRDRIHPDETYFRGRVVVRPGFVHPDLLFSTQKDQALARLHLCFPAPPEWWLSHLNAELAVEQVAFAEDPLPEPPEEETFIHHMLYDIPIPPMDDAAFLEAQPSPREDVFTRSTLLLAARRFHALNAPDRALQYYACLYQVDPDLLSYADLIDAAFDLIRLGDMENAANIARRAVAPGQPLRPGFHLILSAGHAALGEDQEALEHAFIELFGVGEYGEYMEQAKQAYASLVLNAQAPLFEDMRNFHQIYPMGQEAEEQQDWQRAAAHYRAAGAAIQQAAQHARADFLFLREYAAEMQMDICRVEESSFDEARQAFEAILQRDPQFIPAHIQLARIALIEGQPEKAHAIWSQARAMLPFLNQFAYEFRQFVEQPNPDIAITSYPAADLFGENEDRSQDEASGT